MPTRLERDDPFVGFETRARLFVEERAADGATWRVTAPAKRRFFNAQRFPLQKAAGVKRAFCLGGSTTYGHPYEDATSFCGWLRVLLPFADPGSRWEVINAGGISYASYRVALVEEELLAYEPDLFVVYTGHNEFLERRSYDSLWLQQPVLRGLGGLLASTRTFSLVSYAAESLGPHPTPLSGEVDAMLDVASGLDAYRRDDPWRDAVVAHFRVSLERMIRLARGGRASIVLVVPASNLKDCSPFKSQGPPARDADEIFRHARALQGERRFEEAHAAFVRARDEDVCPLRATSPIAASVREIATSRGVPLVDFEAQLEASMRASAGHSSPGAELFLDHVHPTIEANRALAVAIVGALASSGIVARVPDGDEIASATRDVESRIDERAHGRALRRAAKVLSWAGKDEEAARLAEKADAMLGGDAESRFIIGSLQLSRGDDEQAAAQFERALALDPEYVRAHVNLGIAYARLRRDEPARAHYDRALALEPTRANAWYARGLLRRRTGDLTGAIADFERALLLLPDDGDARYELGLSLLDSGRAAEAAATLRELVARNPDDAEARRRLDDAVREMGAGSR